jgi:hypothetical protein
MPSKQPLPFQIHLYELFPTLAKSTTLIIFHNTKFVMKNKQTKLISTLMCPALNNKQGIHIPLAFITWTSKNILQ